MDNTKEIAIFCENIRRLRAMHGLSQKEMAKRLGIGVHSLSLLENGILPKRLGCDVIYLLYQQFGMTPDNMFTAHIEKAQKSGLG